MTTALTTTPHEVVSPWTGLPLPAVSSEAVEQAMMIGDLEKMKPEVRIAYYLAACKSAGLNPLTRPFTALKNQDGKYFLYANKDCAEQLRQIHKVSLSILSRERLDDLYIVTVRGWTADGRQDEAQGIVEIPDKARGHALANLLMRAETKAKRRVTFSLCGLGFPQMDEAPTSQEVRLDLTTGTLPGEVRERVLPEATDAELFDRHDGRPDDREASAMAVESQDLDGTF